MERVITDCHTHCLPAVDDGAVDVSMSVSMLTEAGRQGVSTVVASPHFYPGEMSVEEFLRRRDEAVGSLLPHLPAGAPRLLTGAEVLLRRGVSRLDLRPLCVEGTDWLLVEMPFMPPPHWLAEELEELVYAQQLTLILAHADRYMPWFSARDIAEVTDYPDMVIQLNGEVFTDRRAFRLLRRWLPATQRLLLGSDMHNMERRPPNMAATVKAMEHHRVGRRWLAVAEDTAAELMERAIALG